METSTPLASPPPSSITILWATQAGRAKACARRTVRLLKSTIIIRNDNNVIHNNNFILHGLCAFDEVDFLALGQSSINHHHQIQQQQEEEQSILILFVSTTGDAEQPSSMQKTWSRLLSKSIPTTHFANVKFALFALGDRAYGPDAFCAAGRKLAARLVRCIVKNAILFANVLFISILESKNYLLTFLGFIFFFQIAGPIGGKADLLYRIW